MAILRDPALFSAHFDVDAIKLSRLGLLDPILNADTKLFIDPLLLKVSRHPIIKGDAYQAFETYFGDVIKVLQHSKVPDDMPWRNADRLFTFKEPRETCLGYGDRTTHGNAIGSELRKNLMQTAKQIIDLGIVTPELFALMALLEDNIGADRISDMTTQAIKPALYKFNHEILSTLGIKTEEFQFGGAKYQLARNPFEQEESLPVLLLPKDILRELPIAHDWSDVSSAASKNANLRDEVNKQIGEIWSIRTRKDKALARSLVLKDRKAFETLMNAVGLIAKVPYDPELDIEGHYAWRLALSELAAKHPFKIAKAGTDSVVELERVVGEIIAVFKDLVENKGQWTHLWHGSECRHERAAQRLFFAVADVYCKANNLEISPETNSGGGPVDFKFSSGYAARVIVEIKMSTGKVVHGYETQLEVYKRAENTFRARYLIVDVGGMGSKLEKVFKIKNTRALNSERVSEIYIVDGRQKASASRG